MFTLLVDERHAGINRDQALVALHERNIGTGVHYRAIPDLKVYREHFGWRAEEWPNAKHIGDCTMSLPLSAKLSDEDVEDVVSAVRATLGR